MRISSTISPDQLGLFAEWLDEYGRNVFPEVLRARPPIPGAVDLYDPWDILNREHQIEEDFVFGEIPQRRHEKFRIERDGKLAAFVLNSQRLFRFADLRRVGRDVDVVFGEIEFDRIGFVACQQRHPPQ